MDMDSFLKMLSDAVTGKNWMAVAALGVVAAVTGIRKFLGPKVPFLMTQRGGALLVLLTSGAGALATSLLGGAAFSSGLLLQALSVAIAAAGGRTLLLRLLFGDRASEVEQAAAAAGKVAADVAGKTPASPMDIVNK